MSPGSTLLDHLQRLDGNSVLVVLAVVAAASFIEHVLPPVPGDLGVTVGASIAFARGWSIPPFFCAALAGSLLGAALAWRLGRWLERRTDAPTHPRLLALHARVTTATAPLDRHGLGLIVACRFVPAARAFVVVAAGFRRMPFARVMLAAGLGAALWDGVLFALAAVVGRNLPRLAAWLDAYNRLALASLVVAAVAAVATRAWRVRKSHGGDVT